MFEKYENLVFDITPAPVIFEELSRTPEESEAFFRKYHDRLIFGTDANNNLVGEVREYNDIKTEMVKTFLTGDAPRTVGGKYHIVPIKLENDMVENIYYHNGMRFIK